MTALLRVGTKVRTIDRGARVHDRAPDKPEAIGIVRDHFRPFGRQSKDRRPPYYVTFESGEAAWYDASEVEPMRGSAPRTHHATKKSPAQLDREIAAALAAGPPVTISVHEATDDETDEETYTISDDVEEENWTELQGEIDERRLHYRAMGRRVVIVAPARLDLH
jgi:hypothetical protein